MKQREERMLLPHHRPFEVECQWVEIKVDPTYRTVVVDGTPITLPPKPFKMLALALYQQGVVVCFEQMCSEMYEDIGEPGWDIYKVFATKIRRAHPFFRTMFQTVWGRGYMWAPPCTEAEKKRRSALEKRERPPGVRTPSGVIVSLDNLPQVGDGVTWTPAKKVTVINALLGGLLTESEACRRYCATPGEFNHWGALLSNYGQGGLRVTHLHEYQPPTNFFLGGRRQ